MLSALEYKAKSAAKRTAFGFAGSLALAVGLAFFTGAAWISLTVAADALTACLVLGSAYFGGGLILMAFASRKSHRTLSAPAPTVRSTPPWAEMVAAFMQGYGTGMASRRH